jgi:pyrroloquinoline quinone biosynthesis protein B
VTEPVRRSLEDADCVFFDGTFWSSDELPRLGLGTKRAEEMAHLPIGGPDGSLARLDGLAARRRIFIHLNNTNPLLRDDSPERARVEAAGWEVARDGMEVRI